MSRNLMCPVFPNITSCKTGSRLQTVAVSIVYNLLGMHISAVCSLVCITTKKIETNLIRTFALYVKSSLLLRIYGP